MNDETKRRVAACAAGFALPRYRDLPAVGLYLDQTVQYVNACFRTFCGVELTPSMVSNYVKKGILSHPVKKKYTREQIASLMYIVVSKTVLSMENIDTLFRMQRASYSARDAYDTFCKELEQCLPFVFGCSSTLPEPAPDATDERLLLRSTILSAANKIYLDCCFDALRQEQALWEDILPDLAYQKRETASALSPVFVILRFVLLPCRTRCNARSISRYRRQMRPRDRGCLPCMCSN